MSGYKIKNGLNVSLTQLEIDALSPVEGDIVFNLTIDQLQIYNGTSWDEIEDSSYKINLGRNGNVNANAYLRCSGNVVGTASRGEIITKDCKLEKFSYRVNSSNTGTGTFNLVIRHMDNNGSLLNEAILTLSNLATVISLDLTPAILGWDGSVSANDMLAIQFRVSGTATQLNNVQTTLTLSVQ